MNVRILILQGIGSVGLYAIPFHALMPRRMIQVFTSYADIPISKAAVSANAPIRSASVRDLIFTNMTPGITQKEFIAAVYAMMYHDKNRIESRLNERKNAGLSLSVTGLSAIRNRLQRAAGFNQPREIFQALWAFNTSLKVFRPDYHRMLISLYRNV